MNKKIYTIKSPRYLYGLNIPELCVAIVIMALAVMTIAGMFIAGIMGMKKGDDLVIATNLALSTLELYEEEILYNFTEYNESGSPYTLPGEFSGNIKFTRQMSIKDIVHSSTNKLKKVEISVYWFEKNIDGKVWDKPKEVKFSTYINNYLDYPEK